MSLPGRLVDLDRVLEQEDETAEKIARDVLQAESESHTDGADEHIQRCQFDASGLKNWSFLATRRGTSRPTA